MQPHTTKEIRCFNCGHIGHKSATCQSKHLGVKCFKCNGFGHKGFESRSKRSSASETPTHSNEQSASVTNIEDVEFTALIDTGSQVNIINQHIYNQLHNLKLIPNSIALTGFGKSTVSTIACMESEILIDGSTFLTNFYIVPNDVLSTHDIIGLELLKQAELIVDNNGVQINRLPEDVPVMSIEPRVEHEPDVGMYTSRLPNTKAS